MRMLGDGSQSGMGKLGLQSPDFPGHQLPLRSGDQHPFKFLGGDRGSQQRGRTGKGFQLPGNHFPKTDMVVFDKTGTLTQGVFEVNGIHHNEMENEKLLEYAAHAECASSHPISRSLQRAYGKEVDRSRVENIREISGNGVLATVDGKEVAAGNDKLMAHLGIPFVSCHSVGTIIHIAIEGKYAGIS